jgi:ABC-type sulfate/molybdate transport systems ATPase subunit
MVELNLKLQRGNFLFDIECKFGSLWTVVFGPSGAGKSTLLRLIAGLDSPDSGRISVRGKYVCDTAIGLNLPPGQRAIGMVTQQPALFPHLSVVENIGYGLPSMSPSERHSDIAFMLELVGAADLAGQPVRSLSGGQAQRIALARALAPMPQLLLLDEPLSALDALARDELLSRLQILLAERQIQTILVTHDAADALATTAEVALLREGKLVALGPAQTVLASERKRLLARLNPE